MKRNILFSCLLLFSAMASAQTYKNVYSAKQDWSRIYDHAHLDDNISPVNSFAINDSGDIYLTGSSVRDSAYDQGWLYLAYKNDGSVLWDSVFSYGSTKFKFSNWGNAIIWDSLQQRFYNCGTYTDVFGGVGLAGQFVLDVYKAYNNYGFGGFSIPDPNYSKRLPHYAGAINLCQDYKGLICVTGFMSGYLSGNTLNRTMLTTIKYNIYDTLHPFKWISTYDSVTIAQQIGDYIACDPLNNVIVSGLRADSLEGKENWSLLCVKYDSSGNIKWSRKYANTDTFNLTASSGLAVSKSGSAYMSGNIPSKNAQSVDGIILKYTNQGKLAWSKRISSLILHTQNAGCNGVSLDDSGNVLAIGHIDNDSGEFAVLLKLDSNGHQLWMDTLNDPYNGISSSEAISMTQDDTGNIYVTGTRGDVQSFQDVYTARYNKAGQKQWYIRYNDSVLSFNEPTKIELDKKGNVIVAGSHNGDTTTGADILVLKYSQHMTKVKVHNSAISNSIPQSSNINIFPNPFQDQLYGSIDIKELSSVSFTIYDITGRMVKCLNYNNLPTGINHFEIGASDLETGLYFYKCTIINESGSNILKGKIVKE